MSQILVNSITINTVYENNLVHSSKGKLALYLHYNLFLEPETNDRTDEVREGWKGTLFKAASNYTCSNYNTCNAGIIAYSF